MDDDSAVRMVLTQLMRNSGYDVDCAASGIEAIEAYSAAMKKGNPFAVVVMDLTVPGGMGGKEAVSKLLELDPRRKGRGGERVFKRSDHGKLQKIRILRRDR